MSYRVFIVDATTVRHQGRFTDHAAAEQAGWRSCDYGRTVFVVADFAKPMVTAQMVRNPDYRFRARENCPFNLIDHEPRPLDKLIDDELELVRAAERGREFAEVEIHDHISCEVPVEAASLLPALARWGFDVSALACVPDAIQIEFAWDADLRHFFRLVIPHRIADSYQSALSLRMLGDPFASQAWKVEYPFGYRPGATFSRPLLTIPYTDLPVLLEQLNAGSNRFATVAEQMGFIGGVIDKIEAIKLALPPIASPDDAAQMMLQIALSAGIENILNMLREAYDRAEEGSRTYVEPDVDSACQAADTTHTIVLALAERLGLPNAPSVNIATQLREDTLALIEFFDANVVGTGRLG